MAQNREHERAEAEHLANVRAAKQVIAERERATKEWEKRDNARKTHQAAKARPGVPGAIKTMRGATVDELLLYHKQKERVQPDAASP